MWLIASIRECELSQGQV